MALIHCDFFSETLGISTSMCVILPQETRGQIGMKGSASAQRHPTLYLLHGLSDDHTIWTRRTSIERYAAGRALAVVMPSAGRSFYANMAQGGRYWTFIGKELPALARGFFPLSDAREDNFVAGLSMGGYGAFKLALCRPQCFAAAASLSGALDVAGFSEGWQEERNAEMAQIFGPLDKLPGSEHDLFHLAQKAVSDGARLPALFQCCGTEDPLYEGNIRFKRHAERLGIPVHYVEGPGAHEWGYWDRLIQEVLAWLPLRDRTR